MPGTVQDTALRTVTKRHALPSRSFQSSNQPRQERNQNSLHKSHGRQLGNTASKVFENTEGKFLRGQGGERGLRKWFIN